MALSLLPANMGRRKQQKHSSALAAAGSGIPRKLTLIYHVCQQVGEDGLAFLQVVECQPDMRKRRPHVPLGGMMR